VNLSTRIMTISTLVATAALALGYGLYGEPIGVLIFVALGLLWLVGQRYALQAFAGLGMLGFTIGALLGTLYGAQNGWMLVGIMAALVAWDLQHFIQHMRVSEQTETTPEDAEEHADVEGHADAEKRALERLHLQRLAIVSGLGLLLGALALTVRLTLRFGIILALGLIAIYGLSRLIHYLHQESD
jgi:hypothetical protein